MLLEWVGTRGSPQAATPGGANANRDLRQGLDPPSPDANHRNSSTACDAVSLTANGNSRRTTSSATTATSGLRCGGLAPTGSPRDYRTVGRTRDAGGWASPAGQTAHGGVSLGGVLPLSEHRRRLKDLERRDEALAGLGGVARG